MIGVDVLTPAADACRLAFSAWASIMSLLLLSLLCIVPLDACVAAPAEAKPAARAVRVPYQLTNTKHVLVRVKVNGKGPFNFILDTGAPALFLSEAAAKKAGVEKKETGFAEIGKLELEGGLTLDKVPCRVEDPFQMTGMNKMNVAGARLDGFMGYSVLARFRITYDFTDSHLVWEPLDWSPPEVFGLRGKGGKPPKEVEAMSGLTTFASALIGKRPDPVLEHRGLIGLELEAKGDEVFVKRALKGSPAEAAGLQPGDQILEYDGKDIDSLKRLLDLAGKKKAGAKATLRFKRGGEEKTCELEAIQGL